MLSGAPTMNPSPHTKQGTTVELGAILDEGSFDTLGVLVTEGAVDELGALLVEGTADGISDVLGALLAEGPVLGAILIEGAVGVRLLGIMHDLLAASFDTHICWKSMIAQVTYEDGGSVKVAMQPQSLNNTPGS